MTIKRDGSAVWSGGIKDGKGQVSTGSGALKDQPYGFNTRFEDAPGTNPEELIGAAHAGCFTMALSGQLGQAGLTADELRTKATVASRSRRSTWNCARRSRARARKPSTRQRPRQKKTAPCRSC
jgi:OsmC subfamily peroxiredoxin